MKARERLHFLIIDDCDDIRFLIALKLKRLGHKVSVANGINDAIITLHEIEDIDVILVDFVIHNITGLMLIKKLTELPYSHAIKVFCLASQNDRKILGTLKSIEFDGVFSKPIKSHVFKEEIAQVMGVR